MLLLSEPGSTPEVESPKPSKQIAPPQLLPLKNLLPFSEVGSSPYNGIT